jgi:hypothetical protein
MLAALGNPMPMDEEQVEWWARTRTKGRAHFVWVSSVLVFGLALTAASLIALALFSGWDRAATKLPVALAMSLVGGYVRGVWTWRFMERRYAETVGRGAET